MPFKRVGDSEEEVNQRAYEELRIQRPELRLPFFEALESPYIGIVARGTAETVIAERTAYLISGASRFNGWFHEDEWEIDVPF